MHHNDTTETLSDDASGKMENTEIESPIPLGSPKIPASLRISHPFWLMCCPNCGNDVNVTQGENEEKEPFSKQLTPVLSRSIAEKFPVSAKVLINQYISYCRLYTTPGVRVNPGVLTALRFSLPHVRVSGDFHDADMLALVDLLLEHSNNSLKHIRRLDFSVGSQRGKLHGLKGFSGHGAYALSQVLYSSRNIKEVYLHRNRLGSFGANAIFSACAQNPTIEVLLARRCLIGEKGAAAFARYIIGNLDGKCGLKEVDLSVNRFGYFGCKLIEKALIDSLENGDCRSLEVDLEGNLVFQEVMNSVTHGLGIILVILGTLSMTNRVAHKSLTHNVSCAIYSLSLLTLYVSSTLYHSFFTLINTRYVFEIFDKCAIYILIAGSYTPLLSISLGHKIIWSRYLLAFIWFCGLTGISVEAFYSRWRYKRYFSLSMYLAMGWCCLVCLPDLLKVLPHGAVNCIVMGGVAYTSGVPFFLRNNNLDHSIWHCFVLTGSIFHWVAVYYYVAVLEIEFE